MKKKINISIFLLVFSLLLSEAGATTSTRTDAERYGRIQYLQGVVDSLKKDIAGRETLISKERAPQKIHYISMEIATLKDRLETAEKDFIDYAADASIFEDDKSLHYQPKSLVEDFQEVVTPVVISLKRASERPRRIEGLKAQMEILSKKIKQADKGLLSITDLVNSSSSQELKKELIKAKVRVEKFKEELVFKLSVIQDQLEEESINSKPFVESLGDSLQSFISSKGKNLLFAILATLTTLFVLFGFERFFLKQYLYVSRFHFISKPIESLFGILSVVASLLCGLLTLYVLDDWFLFTLFLLILLALVWSLKHLFVRFIDAIKLMFGLGTVKAGQRINYEGCPWRVKRLGMNTLLENEFLEDGAIKVDITKLMGLSSRKIHKDDPLFPTKKGDWVVLSDGVYGKVAVQSHEQVVVEVNGVSPKFYSTSNFVSLMPQNISRGFMIETILSLDYKHQKEMSLIVDVLKKELKNVELEGLKSLSVYFTRAGAHSLDININAIFDGSGAYKYRELSGLLQQNIVAICTKQNYEIAFEQLSVSIKNSN